MRGCSQVGGFLYVAVIAGRLFLVPSILQFECSMPFGKKEITSTSLAPEGDFSRDIECQAHSWSACVLCLGCSLCVGDSVLLGMCHCLSGPPVKI